MKAGGFELTAINEGKPELQSSKAIKSVEQNI